MQALFLVLNKTDQLNHVLKALYDCGVRGATIMNSTGMGRQLSRQIPIFASLGYLADEDRPYNYTIFAVMKDEKVAHVIDALNALLGDLSRPGTGIVFTVPVGTVVGLAPEGGPVGPGIDDNRAHGRRDNE
ncbi:MAG: P-II family nitrogen regulator [Bacteroidota bacterium]